MTQISGILRNPIGQPIIDYTIELKARKTGLTVIAKAEASLSSDQQGYYSMDVEPGEYSISVYRDGCPKNWIGNIRVYSDSPNGSLNDFLISDNVSNELTPESLKQFQMLSQSAQNSANEAKKQADNAQNALSASNIAGIVKQQMRKVLYIDNIKGSDDNDGLSSAKPLKTFYQASVLIPSGATATLHVMTDYTFGQDEKAVAFQGANILIRSQFTNAPVTIKFSYHVPADYPEQYFMNSFIFYYSGSIEFYSINLQLPEVPADHASGKYYPHAASVVRTNSSNLTAIQLGVRLSTVDIIVPEAERSEWNLIGNQTGMTDLVSIGVTMPTAWRDRNKVFFQGQLSETAFCRRTINTTTALSNDSSVYNDGKVK